MMPHDNRARPIAFTGLTPVGFSVLISKGTIVRALSRARGRSNQGRHREQGWGGTLFDHCSPSTVELVHVLHDLPKQFSQSEINAEVCAMEFKEFLSSVFSSWVEMAGIVLTLLPFIEKIPRVKTWLSDKPLIDRFVPLIWIVGLSCVLWGVYAAWRDQYRQVRVLQGQLGRGKQARTCCSH